MRVKFTMGICVRCKEPDLHTDTSVKGLSYAKLRTVGRTHALFPLARVQNPSQRLERLKGRSWSLSLHLGGEVDGDRYPGPISNSK